ncbi:MAG: hypothetical protein ACRDJH_15635 [Thermomicrobiales bacterium]
MSDKEHQPANAPVAIRQIAIRRFHGQDFDFTIDDLSPAINIIRGPNASGKTTTALALQGLLWPAAAPANAAVTGHLHLDGATWRVDVDNRRALWQQDGADAPMPDLGQIPFEARDRYLLTLHDLIDGTNAAFAAAIQRESAGGYDLHAAVEELGFRRTPHRRRTEQHASRAARDVVRNLRRDQDGLVAQERSLATLRDRYQDALAADAQGDVFAIALTHVEAVQRREAVRRGLDAFPPSVALLTGNEIELLEEIERDLAARREQHRAQLRDVEAAETRRAKTGLAGAPLTDGLVPQLRAACQALQTLAARLDAATADVAGLTRNRLLARQRVGAAVTDDQIAALDTGAFEELVALARRFEATRAQREAFRAVELWLSGVEPPANLDRLREGVGFLQRRLRLPATAEENRQTARLRLALWAAALVIAVEALALGALVHWAFVAVVLVAVALVYLMRRLPPSTAAADLLEAEYRKLGLDDPASWTIPAIEQLADGLSRRLQLALVDDEKARRWAGLAEQRQHATDALAMLEHDRAELAARLGVAPSIDAESLGVIARNLVQWQEADSRLRTAETRLQTAHDEFKVILHRLNEQLGPFVSHQAADVSSAIGLVEDLEERWLECEMATTANEHARRTLDQIVQPNIDDLERKQTAFRERIALPLGDTATLRRWLDHLPAFHAAQEELAKEQAIIDQTNARLEDANVNDVDLRTLSPQDLLHHIHELEDQAAQADDVSRQIVQIETLIDGAKRQSALSDALAAHQTAKHALAAAREEDSALLAGWELADFVRQRTQDFTRPNVFHRARVIFTRITRGRYRLDFDERSGPAFRAYDTTLDRGFALDELSSATRIQLLMAVRIAFVEEVEQGPRLPLILDETLGNSDDLRAGAMIDAAIEIARTGRQIFYFTAQQGEVAKWEERLLDANLALRIIDLADVRRLAEADRPPVLNVVVRPPPALPIPDGHDRATYRDLIGVPRIDPWGDGLGHVHLWYLVTDLSTLHRLMHTGVGTWGQLCHLIDHGGSGIVDLSPDDMARIRARCRLVQAIVDGWCIGRSRPFDRQTLAISGAVSGTFLPRVADILDQCDDSAVSLLAELEGGAVHRFGPERTNELRTYLTDHGYLPDRPPLSPEDLRLRALAALAPDVEAGLLTFDDVTHLLADVTVSE